jgi:dCTP deaminase
MSRAPMPRVPSQHVSTSLIEGDGVLASQHLFDAVRVGVIHAGGFEVPPENIQPASLDLRLGEVAYRLRCSFLSDNHSVEQKYKELRMDELDLHKDGAVLETNRPYLIPLKEQLALPRGMRAKANPKSSTGRLDVFTRVITDGGNRFDEIAEGYEGPLYLEVVPLSFAVKVRENLSLNQLRLSIGRTEITDDEIRALHDAQPILWRRDVPVPAKELLVSNGLYLGVGLRGNPDGYVGYSAKRHTPLLDMTASGPVDPEPFWEPVQHEAGDRLVLDPRLFYLLMSDEAVRIPPEYACEMTAYDPTSGELRTHYAGFFDPGFGHDAEGRFHGSRAALEVRAHDVPFMIEHGQPVCKLTFERMLEPPEHPYSRAIGSSYQNQYDPLSKYFDGPPPAQMHSEPGKAASDEAQLEFTFEVSSP